MAQVKSHQRRKLEYNAALATLPEPQDGLQAGAVPRIASDIKRLYKAAGPNRPNPLVCDPIPASDVTREASLYAYPSVHASGSRLQTR